MKGRQSIDQRSLAEETLSTHFVTPRCQGEGVAERGRARREKAPLSLHLNNGAHGRPNTRTHTRPDTHWRGRGVGGMWDWGLGVDGEPSLPSSSRTRDVPLPDPVPVRASFFFFSEISIQIAY